MVMPLGAAPRPAGDPAATDSGRGPGRRRMLLWSVLANFASKGVSLVSLFVSVPLTIAYLGPERFGVWMTIASLASLLSLLDLGVGNSLVNEAARASAANDRRGLQALVVTGLAVLGLIGLGAALSLLCLAWLVPPSALFAGAGAALHPEIRDTAVTFAVLFGLSMPLQGLQKIVTGMQQPYWVHAVNGVAAVLALGALVLAALLQASIPVLLLASYGIPVVGSLALLLVLRPHLAGMARPAWEEARPLALRLAKRGGLFFVLQAAVAVMGGMDNAILSLTLGPASVATFAVTQRLFQLVYQPLAVLNAPLWPAYADAMAQGDTRFIRRTLRRSVFGSCALAAAGSALLLAFHEPLIRHWTHQQVDPPVALVLGMAVWVVIDATSNAFAMYLNGTSVIRAQIVVMSALVAVLVPLKFAAVARWGVSGVPLASVAAFLVIVVLPYMFVFRQQVLGPIAPRAALA
ncbi:lipopolysaccharide biosynthesis protein [Methylibium sp.]|uniref:lipopolysaccharide biosynthesis protein n=1 Tax=Methylibium sp. TaxID=2067992 RepID=UPI003D120CFB